MFRSLFICLLFSGAVSAHAGILFEPYVGYSVGNTKVDGGSGHPDANIAALDTTGTIEGLDYGARLAFIYGRFVMGAEYQGVRAKEKLKGVDESVNWNSTAVYGLAGWRFLTGIRLFFAMTVQPFVATEDTTPEAGEFSGSARKVVLGYEYHAPIAVNIEYVEYDLKDYKMGSADGKVKDYYDKFNYTAVMFNVSFPFELGSSRR